MHDRETTSYIPWRLFGGLLLVSLVLGAFAFFKPFRLTFGDHLLDIMSALYALFLALVCFYGSWKLVRTASPSGLKQGGQRFIPALLGIGMLWVTLALLVGWVFQTIQAQQAPTYPSLFHALSFGAYPFFIGAILLLPSQNLSWLSRLRILLDSLIIMTTVATLYGYVILVPILVTIKGTILQKTVGSLFTAADLVLLFCLFFVALQGVRGAIRPVIVLLTLAVVIVLVEHVVYLSLVLSTESSLTIRPVPALLVYFTLIAVAAQTIRRMLDRGGVAERGPTVLLEETGFFAQWKLLFGYVLVLIFALLLLSLANHRADTYTPVRLQVVNTGGTLILILLVLRQFFAMHEVNTLKRDLRAKNSELHILNIQLDKLAASDPLTNVPNHRTLITRLDEEMARAKEQQTPCSILFIDIDKFKTINDQHGHAVGDLVLCRVSELASSFLRSNDCFGRWGGEEFVAVLSGQNLTEAFNVAERIRVAVSEQLFAGQADLHVTCSLGVATYPQTTTDPKQLVNNADQAMYEAKRFGRNQVRIACGTKGTPPEKISG